MEQRSNLPAHVLTYSFDLGVALLQRSSCPVSIAFAIYLSWFLVSAGLPSIPAEYHRHSVGPTVRPVGSVR